MVRQLPILKFGKKILKTIELQSSSRFFLRIDHRAKTALNAWIKKNKISKPKETEQNKEFLLHV